MFNPYSIEKIADKFYIKVITYNPKIWHPWGTSYIAESGYPVKIERLKYAKNFQTEEEAQEFISSIYK